MISSVENCRNDTSYDHLRNSFFVVGPMVIRLPQCFQISLPHFFIKSFHELNREKSFKPYRGDLTGAPNTTCFYTFLGP